MWEVKLFFSSNLDTSLEVAMTALGAARLFILSIYPVRPSMVERELEQKKACPFALKAAGALDFTFGTIIIINLEGASGFIRFPNGEEIGWFGLLATSTLNKT